MYVPRGRKARPRLSMTGKKVYNVVGLIFLEDIEKAGFTHGDLMAYLDNLHVRCAISPIHDRDHWTADDVWGWCEERIDPETGDLDLRYLDSAPYVGKAKKPHVHILFMFPRQTSAEEVTELLSGLLDVRVTMWEKAVDPSAALRYFAHLNSPEKAQYSPYDIIGFGGIKLDALMEVSKSETAEITRVLVDIIMRNNIFYFCDLVTAVYDMDDPQVISVMFGRNVLFNQIINSRRQKKFDGELSKKKGRELSEVA